MADARTRRPPAGRLLGDDRAHRADEESLREDLAHLRSQYAMVRREGAEVRDLLRGAERDSLRKDKLLQELLSAAKGGPGVPGEALDNLKEDLQALLRAKRFAQEVRQQLDEKEAKIATIQQELRSTNLEELEAAVAAAKAEAKAKAEEWAQLSSGEEDAGCFVESQRLQKECQEIEKQKEQCEQSLAQMGSVEVEHQRTQEGRDAAAKRLDEAKATSETAADPRTTPAAKTAVIRVTPGDSPAHRLLPRHPPAAPAPPAAPLKDTPAPQQVTPPPPPPSASKVAAQTPQPVVPPSPPWAPEASEAEEEEDERAAMSETLPEPPEAPPPPDSPPRRSRPSSAKSGGGESYDEEEFDDESEPEEE